ncbi:hypothetical protein GOODEAATRI_017147, partial [Goodea atripinnis]
MFQKRLRSSGEEEDEEARRSCARRPNPEGSLSASELSCYGKPEEKMQQRLCQRCHIMASQLNRQAAALADSASMKMHRDAAFGCSEAIAPLLVLEILTNRIVYPVRMRTRLNSDPTLSCG